MISRPDKWGIGCLLQRLGRNWSHYNSTILYRIWRNGLHYNSTLLYRIWRNWSHYNSTLLYRIWRNWSHYNSTLLYRILPPPQQCPWNISVFQSYLTLTFVWRCCTGLHTVGFNSTNIEHSFHILPFENLFRIHSSLPIWCSKIKICCWK